MFYWPMFAMTTSVMEYIYKYPYKTATVCLQNLDEGIMEQYHFDSRQLFNWVSAYG